MNAKEKILLVDDDEITLQMLGANLDTDYDVRFSKSAEDALRVVERDPVDLIVLDVNLPGMNGYDACRHLRGESATARLPILFLSAQAAIEERLRGYSVGGDDYLTKPFDSAELLTKIRKSLAHRQAERDLNQQLEDVTNAVLSTADMVGEAGVVLDYYRRLARAETYAEIAQATFDALNRYGLNACVRLQGRDETLSLNGTGPCTALEHSILDHIQALPGGTGVRAMGQHTGFSYGNITLFVRDLPMLRLDAVDKLASEGIGRAIDNVCLLIEGALSRIKALDCEMVGRDLSEFKRLVTLTRDALVDVSQRNHAQTDEVRGLFEHLVSDVEASFVHLGLSDSQENYLGSVVRQSMDSVMLALGRSREVEEFLAKIVHKLGKFV